MKNFNEEDIVDIHTRLGYSASTPAHILVISSYISETHT